MMIRIDRAHVLSGDREPPVVRTLLVQQAPDIRLRSPPRDHELEMPLDGLTLRKVVPAPRILISEYPCRHHKTHVNLSQSRVLIMINMATRRWYLVSPSPMFGNRGARESFANGTLHIDMPAARKVSKTRSRRSTYFSE
eukprot:COSAG01_NODE_9041_length_2572_cov_4.925192_5_plen_139_part_00